MIKVRNSKYLIIGLAGLAFVLHDIYTGRVGLGRHLGSVAYKHHPIIFVTACTVWSTVSIALIGKGIVDLSRARRKKARKSGIDGTQPQDIFDKDLMMLELTSKSEKENVVAQPTDPVQAPQQYPPANDSVNTEPQRAKVIYFVCGCGRKVKVPSKYAGRMGKCPRCQKKIRIPESS